MADLVWLDMTSRIYKFTVYDEVRHSQAGFQPQKEEAASTWCVHGATEPESLRENIMSTF